MKQLQELQTIEEWNIFKSQISLPPVGLIIFKFSPICPISHSVERTFDEWYAGLPENTVIMCVKIDVVNSRSLSQQIAQEFGVQHESPQAIWIQADHHVHWHASHYSITPKALDTQLQK
jgi:bacillithiol system protein YtxJ